ncbi:gas vesicle protein [Streptomyces sp. NPDC060131]|uniref:gas vesicle protein GvpO n=1 Tax=unclassified Streptomyces TaxID=2593676 RepID=UPI00365C5DFF
MVTTDSKDGEEKQTRIDISTAMRKAVGQLAELLQREPGSVSALKATDDGWTADVEVVEIEKIPDTTSVMASYRVSLGDQGRLVGYDEFAGIHGGRSTAESRPPP